MVKINRHQRRPAQDLRRAAHPRAQHRCHPGADPHLCLRRHQRPDYHRPPARRHAAGYSRGPSLAWPCRQQRRRARRQLGHRRPHPARPVSLLQQQGDAHRGGAAAGRQGADRAHQRVRHAGRALRDRVPAGQRLLGRPLRRGLHPARGCLVVRRQRALSPRHQGRAGDRPRRPLPIQRSRCPTASLARRRRWSGRMYAGALPEPMYHGGPKAGGHRHVHGSRRHRRPGPSSISCSSSTANGTRTRRLPASRTRTPAATSSISRRACGSRWDKWSGFRLDRRSRRQPCQRRAGRARLAPAHRHCRQLLSRRGDQDSRPAVAGGGARAARGHGPQPQEEGARDRPPVDAGDGRGRCRQHPRVHEAQERRRGAGAAAERHHAARRQGRADRAEGAGLGNAADGGRGSERARGRRAGAERQRPAPASQPASRSGSMPTTASC